MVTVLIPPAKDGYKWIQIMLTKAPCICSAALEVELSDDSFPPEDFGIVSGMLNVKWERIAPYPFTSANVGNSCRSESPS